MSNTKTIWSVIAGLLSSVFAFLGIVSCCGMPILAGVLAALGIGASQLSFFVEFRGWFIAFAIISLLFGFYQVYFKRSCSCCCEETASDKSLKKQARARGFQKMFLWVGAVIILVLLLVGNRVKQPTIEGSCCPAQQEAVLPAVEGCCGSVVSEKAESCCATANEMPAQELENNCCKSNCN